MATAFGLENASGIEAFPGILGPRHCVSVDKGYPGRSFTRALLAAVTLLSGLNVS